MDIPAAIDLLCAQLHMEFNLHPVIGVEVEAYVNPTGIKDPAEVPMADILSALELELRSQGIKLYDVLQERGDNQLEVALKESRNIATVLGDIQRTLKTLQQLCVSEGLDCLSSAKPFPKLPGNGLHIHISMVDDWGSNAFYKKNEEISLPLSRAIAGTLLALPESMVIFAPNEASYARFQGEEPEAPSTISWGANNRTTALRLPDSSDGFRHLEHRVPGMDADPALAILALLSAIHYGLGHAIEPPEQIYGNAFMPQYNLPRLPQSLEEARKVASNAEILPDYFGEVWDEILL